MQENGSGMMRDEMGAERAALQELGNYLRHTRESRGLGLAEVVETTKIRSRYLQAIEDGDLSIMPGIVYARGFIRSYADFLGLDGVKLTAQYLSARDVPDINGSEVEEAPDYQSMSYTPSNTRVNVRKQGQTNDGQKRSLVHRALSKERHWSMQSRIGAVAIALVFVTLIIVLSTALNQPTAKKTVESAAPIPAHTTKNSKTGTVKHHTAKAVTTKSNVVLTQVSSTPVSSSFQVTTGVPLKLSVTGVSGRCWIQVIGDGQMLVTSAIVAPGQIESWTAAHSIQIDAGASRYLSMTINGMPVPLAKTATGGYTYSFVKK